MHYEKFSQKSIEKTTFVVFYFSEIFPEHAKLIPEEIPHCGAVWIAKPEFSDNIFSFEVHKYIVVIKTEKVVSEFWFCESDGPAVWDLLRNEFCMLWKNSEK